MNTSTPEGRETLVFRLAVISTLVFLVIILAITGFELYVRWFVNKDFTFLGGFELEALTLSAGALILGLLYAYRPSGKQS